MKYVITACAFVFSFGMVVGQERKFSAKQLKDDLVYMAGKFEEVHPNMYHDISKEDYHKLIVALSNSFKDSMTYAEAWPLFAKAVGAVNEGHTQISWPEAFSKLLTENKLAYFPFFIKEFDGEGLIVETDASDENHLKPGDRIVKINGIPVKQLMHRFEETVGGLPAWKSMQVTRSIRTYLAMYNIAPPYQLEYISNGITKNAVTQALYRTKIFENRNQRIPEALPAANYTYENLNGIGYLNFLSMSEPKKFSELLDSVFASIEKENISGLIVDLRQNGGGNSSLGVELLRHITDKPFRMAGGVVWKISQAYKDYYNGLKAEQRFMGQTQESRYMNAANGETIEFISDAPRAQGFRKIFNGKVCFLIGPKTYSSANMLANAIKDYHLATLIGEPTGEAPNDYGELIFLNLPETGIAFFTSTKQYIRANGDAKDRNPIFPDIEMKDDPSTLKDEVLEFAKQWIKK